MKRLAICLSLVAILAGCSAPEAPAVQQTPGVQQVPVFRDADHGLAPDPFLDARVKVFTQLFEAYYRACSAGDEAAVAALTGGAFAAHAAATLAADKDVAFEVVKVDRPAGGVYENEVAPTVTVRRAGQALSLPFKVTLVDGAWRITDAADPEHPGRWLGDRGRADYRLQDFFEAYYEARRAGQRITVETMTGGAYRERALATLGAGTEPGRVLNVTGWGAPVEQEPTVLFEGDKGSTFRVEQAGETWRIVDMLDPATGRWLGGGVEPSKPFPAAFRPGLEAHLREFFQAQSYATKQSMDLPRIYDVCEPTYANYIRNLVRGSAATSQEYTVTAVDAKEWVGDTVEARVSYTLTQDAQKAAPGEVRLRARLHADGWRVVDSFLPEEGAWASTLFWKGLFVAGDPGQ